MKEQVISTTSFYEFNIWLISIKVTAWDFSTMLLVDEKEITHYYVKYKM